MVAVAERFWSKVAWDGPIPNCAPELGPCWLWTAYTDRHGYGSFWVGDRKTGRAWLAHRFSFTEANGPITSPQLDHLCRTRSCVRPSHLEEVTARQNTLRGDTIMAAHAAQTECINGHPFDLFNTYINPAGTRRRCRTCNLAADRRRYARRRLGK